VFFFFFFKGIKGLLRIENTHYKLIIVRDKGLKCADEIPINDKLNHKLESNLQSFAKLYS